MKTYQKYIIVIAISVVFGTIADKIGGAFFLGWIGGILALLVIQDEK